MIYKKHLLIFLFLLHIGCKEEDKKATPITSTGSKNINQVIGLKDDDKIEVLNQKTTSQDLYNFMNPKEAIKNAKRQKDSIKKDSIKKDSIKKDSIKKDSIKKIKKEEKKKRKKRKSKKGKNKTTHNMPYNPPVLKKKKLIQGGQYLAINKEEPKHKLYKAKIERSIILNPSQRTQISLRLEESVKLNDKEEIPKYYEITGYTTLNQDRLIISFQNTIINNQVVNIEDIKVYDTDKILGLKVYLKEVQNKKQIVNTASKIASNVASIALKSTASSIANTVVRDAQSYGSQKIYNNITVEKNRPLFLQFTRQK